MKEIQTAMKLMRLTRGNSFWAACLMALLLVGCDKGPANSNSGGNSPATGGGSGGEKAKTSEV